MPVEIIRHVSQVLADNPLGDPVTRELAIYLPPSYAAEPARRYPTVTFLTGYTGSGVGLLNRNAWTPALDERMDGLIAGGHAVEALIVLPDCFTRYGGAQYVDSPAIGRYAGYVADEITAFVDARFRTLSHREARGVIGKSSGGYGALTLAMERPDVFGAVASHAGDSAFELSCLPEFGKALVAFERHGGVAGFLAWFDAQAPKPSAAVMVMATICCAAAWSPSGAGPYGYGEGFDLPFDRVTGELDAVAWRRWLARDPVRMLGEPRHLDAMRSMRAIFLDAGRSDEFNLQLGTRQLARRLAAAGIAHVHEEFDGGHMSTHHRYDRSLEVITRALAAE